MFTGILWFIFVLFALSVLVSVLVEVVDVVLNALFGVRGRVLEAALVSAEAEALAERFAQTGARGLLKGSEKGTPPIIEKAAAVTWALGAKSKSDDTLNVEWLGEVPEAQRPAMAAAWWTGIEGQTTRRYRAITYVTGVVAGFGLFAGALDIDLYSVLQQARSSSFSVEVDLQDGVGKLTEPAGRSSLALSLGTSLERAKRDDVDALVVLAERIRASEAKTPTEALQSIHNVSVAAQGVCDAGPKGDQACAEATLNRLQFILRGWLSVEPLTCIPAALEHPEKPENQRCLRSAQTRLQSCAKVAQSALQTKTPAKEACAALLAMTQPAANGASWKTALVTQTSTAARWLLAEARTLEAKDAAAALTTLETDRIRALAGVTRTQAEALRTATVDALTSGSHCVGLCIPQRTKGFAWGLSTLLLALLTAGGSSIWYQALQKLVSARKGAKPTPS